MSERTRRPRAVAAFALAAIAALLVVALLTAPGPHPYGVLGPEDDRFADYFKFILSFPGGTRIIPGSLFGLHDLIAGYQAHNPYHGATDLPRIGCSHLHAPPLMALFCLVNLAAMRILEPALCFALIVPALGAIWTAIALRWAGDRREGLLWCLAGLISYPFLFMVARGNVYAGITSFAIVAAMLLSARGHRPVAAAILLAIAVNLRPNAIVLLPAMLLIQRTMIRLSVVVFTAAAAAMFGLCLLAAHALYPGYTLGSFRAGLQLYYTGYVVGDDGLPFGSSLFGGLKFMVGYRPGMDFAALIAALAILGTALLLGAVRAIRPGVLLFLSTATYCLGSSVIADYHLFVFIAPAMLLAHELDPSDPASPEGIAFLTSCLMLVPLNYAFHAGISWQVLLHPAALLIAAIAILGPAIEAATRSGRLASLGRRLTPGEASRP